LMSDALPEELSVRLAALSRAIDTLSATVAPLLALSADEIRARLSGCEGDLAKLRLFLAYAVNALFYMYLKTQGVPAESHPVTNEIKRVQEYFEKLKALSGTTPSRNSRVDSAAAKRFVDHAQRIDLSAPGDEGEDRRARSDAGDKQDAPEERGERRGVKRSSHEGDKSDEETPRRTKKSRKHSSADKH